MSSSLFPMNQMDQKQNNGNGVSQVNDYLERTGQTPEQAVRNICRERGIDVDQLLRMIKNMT